MNRLFVRYACRAFTPVLAFATWTASVPAQQRVALDAVSATATDATLARTISIRLDNVSLRRAMTAIATAAKVEIYYQVELLDAVTTPVSVRAERQPLGIVLGQVLAGARLRAVESARGVVSIRPVEVDPVVQGAVSGSVIDRKTNRPVSGASVFIDNATTGVVTGEDGGFRIAVPVGEHTIRVRAVGYAKYTSPVTIADGRATTLSITLEPSTSVLSEVVVTGSVVATERKAITTPITVITAADIEKRGITRIDQLMRGEIPGVLALEQGSGVYGAYDASGMVSTQVYSRGASTIDGGATPLKTYVDGVELLNPKYLGTIDPKTIERIEIVTGPQAATVYGAGAMGGVMQIFTKKGAGRTTPDLTLTLLYGMIENSMSAGRAPRHDDALNAAGGAGPVFSYSGNLSHAYSGQWQPNLFSRSLSASVGASHVRGPVTVSGSVSIMNGKNGTYAGGPGYAPYISSGEWRPGYSTVMLSNAQSVSASQTLALNVDYSMSSAWQHHLTMGRSQNTFESLPVAPSYRYSGDTLFRQSSLTGQRATFGYNMTIAPRSIGMMSSTLTVGATGARGRQLSVEGYTPLKAGASLSNTYVYRPLDEESWGGFGQLRLGVFERLFVTLGVRGEKDPSYGEEHPIDWTPTNGIAYTAEMGDLTVKVLGSYGRATRSVSAARKAEAICDYGSDWSPSQYKCRVANPFLTPEYSRGPQGGVELYFGNRASLTINHYQQKIVGLTTSIKVDSVFSTRRSDGITTYFAMYQTQNIGDVRQLGWEGSGSLNFGPVSFKGSYSWTDSRVVNGMAGTWNGSCCNGQLFIGVPSHFGSGTASYARGGTSVSLVTNFMGKMLFDGVRGPLAPLLYTGAYYNRLPMYGLVAIPHNDVYARDGYAKSDLAVSRRLTPWASLTLNVVNLGNSYGSEADYMYPTIGRQASIGITLRNRR